MMDRAEALLEHLRAVLAAPGVTYAEPPAPFSIPLILTCPRRPLASRARPERARDTDAVADLNYPAIRFVPAGVMGVPRALRALVAIAARVLAHRHVRAYRRRHPLDSARLACHEALACMRGFLRTAEARAAARPGGVLNPLDASVFGDRLCARFARITGVMPVLPAPTPP